MSEVEKDMPLGEFEQALSPNPSGSPGPQLDAEPAAATADPAMVSREEFDRLRIERDDLLRSLVRLQADFENYRKRIERDRAAEYHRALGSSIEPILPVLDDFESALTAHRDAAYKKYGEGFELIYRRLWAALSKLGVERIEAQGKPFDPHEHQAVERVESAGHEDGTVLEVLRPGYRFHDRILRPAMVRVAVHPAETPPASRREN
jgi:molecular chaperone GrpE